MALGRKTGGRKPGSVNKLTKMVRAVLDPLIDKSHLLVEQVLDGKLPCGVCRGKGKTKYQPAKGENRLLERTCQSCYGSGFERLSPGERLRAALEIMEYGHAKRKAVEIAGIDGQPIQHTHTLIFKD